MYAHFKNYSEDPMDIYRVTRYLRSNIPQRWDDGFPPSPPIRIGDVMQSWSGLRKYRWSDLRRFILRSWHYTREKGVFRFLNIDTYSVEEGRAEQRLRSRVRDHARSLRRRLCKGDRSEAGDVLVESSLKDPPEGGFGDQVNHPFAELLESRPGGRSESNVSNAEVNTIKEPGDGVHLVDSELPDPYNIGSDWYAAVFQVVGASIGLFKGAEE